MAKSDLTVHIRLDSADLEDTLFRLSAMGRAMLFDYEQERKAQTYTRAVVREIRAKFRAMLAERFG